MKRIVSTIDGLTNAGFSIDTELEGTNLMQQTKELERREREGGLMATHSVR
jgi:hypothetical protein